jgi:hypothetical protein
MGLVDPSHHHDKAHDWIEYFGAQRRQEILDLLTDEIIDEHKANPIGYRKFHSPELQRVLNYFRTQPILGKYYVYSSEPWEDYRIAVVVERGKAPAILEEPVFASEEEAMHGVFLRRVADLRAEG